MSEPNENDPPRDRPWERGGRDRDADRPGRRDESDDDEEDRPRRRPRDDDYEDEEDRPRRNGPRAESNGLATAGLILGVLSFCTCGLAGLPAVVCSAIALGKPTGRGMAIAGLVLGLIGTLAGAGVGVALMLPAVQKVREAAARKQDENNLKRIGLAFHNQAANEGFTAPFAVDARGTVNRDLSFRVGLLPYVEQNALYKQFDLTQPWDGPKNRAPSNTPVKEFTSPSGLPQGPTLTPYRVFYGGGALFHEDGRPIALANVTDGTSNTILMVYAAEQVPWAEPRELLYSPTGPLPQLGAKGADGALVLMADGSVRTVRKAVSERTLRAAITRAGGEILGSDW